jgi:hypothetical protein
MIPETVPKINTVILSEVKNLIFSYFKKRRSFDLQPHDDTERQTYENFRTLVGKSKFVYKI